MFFAFFGGVVGFMFDLLFLGFIFLSGGVFFLFFLVFGSVCRLWVISFGVWLVSGGL